MNHDDRAVTRWSKALSGRGGLILALLGWASTEVVGEQTAKPSSSPAAPRSVSFWIEPSTASADGSKNALPWFREHYRDPDLMRREYYDGPIPPEQKAPVPLGHYELRNLVDVELRCDDVHPNRKPVAIERHVMRGDRYRRMPYNVADWWKQIQAIVTNPACKVGQERVTGLVTTVAGGNGACTALYDP